jgi:chemotaxis protein histidine kinase CheA
VSTQNKEFEIIEPPDTLQNKVTYSATGVDLNMLEKAEQIIAGLQDSYLEWVQEDLSKLQALYEEALARPDQRMILLKDVFRIAHDIKGQGGSFGYDLMTVVGNHLCRFVEALDEVDEAELDVIKLHLDSMRLIIAQRLEGAGGAAGDKIVAGLQAVIAKVGKRA